MFVNYLVKTTIGVQFATVCVGDKYGKQEVWKQADQDILLAKAQADVNQEQMSNDGYVYFNRN